MKTASILTSFLLIASIATAPPSRPMKTASILPSFLLRAPIAPAQRAEPVDGAPREPYLSNVTQLTSGFEKAGEAYFSPDMKWIIFQAAPKGQQQYQMFVAKV